VIYPLWAPLLPVDPLVVGKVAHGVAGGDLVVAVEVDVVEDHRLTLTLAFEIGEEVAFEPGEDLRQADTLGRRVNVDMARRGDGRVQRGVEPRLQGLG